MNPDRSGGGLVTKNMKDRGYNVHEGWHGGIELPGVQQLVPAEKAGNLVHEDFTRVDRAYYVSKNRHDTPTQGKSGRRGDHPHDPSDYVYGGGEQGAWSWAETAASRLGGRPVVYDVTPVGHIDGDPILNPEGKYSAELTADRLNVKDVRYMPPPRKGQVVQGTLPGENWNKHVDSRYYATASGELNYDIRNQVKPEWVVNNEERGDARRRVERRNPTDVVSAAQFTASSKAWQIPGQQTLPFDGGAAERPAKKLARRRDF